MTATRKDFDSIWCYDCRIAAKNVGQSLCGQCHGPNLGVFNMADHEADDKRSRLRAWKWYVIGLAIIPLIWLVRVGSQAVLGNDNAREMLRWALQIFN